MKIFLTNDDGIGSEGLQLLAEALSKRGHEILVIAPLSEKSACSHSLSIRKPMRLKRTESAWQAYALDGTPADCVKFMHLRFADFRPDLIISGINRGENLGRDVHYSGTVGAAMEGGTLGYRALAVSSDTHQNNNFGEAAGIVCRNLEALYALDFKNTVYNINIPNIPLEQMKGIVFTRLGEHTFDDHYVEEEEGVFMLTGDPLPGGESEQDTDVALLREGYVTITPILCNKTNQGILSRCPSSFGRLRE